MTLYRPGFQIKSAMLAVASLAANNHKLEEMFWIFTLFFLLHGTLRRDDNFFEGKGYDSNTLNEDLFCCRRGWQMNFREAFNLRHTACVISSGAGEVERNDNLTKISLWLILHKHVEGGGYTTSSFTCLW